MVTATRPTRGTLTSPPTLRTLPGATATSVMLAASSGVTPGCSTPPATSMSPATVPLPPSVPPRTSTELSCEPTTESLPARTLLAAGADGEVRFVDVARVGRKAVGPAPGDLRRLPSGRFVGVFLLTRPDGDVGDVVRPHVAIALSVDVGRPEQ